MFNAFTREILKKASRGHGWFLTGKLRDAIERALWEVDIAHQKLSEIAEEEAKKKSVLAHELAVEVQDRGSAVEELKVATERLASLEKDLAYAQKDAIDLQARLDDVVGHLHATLQENEALEQRLAEATTAGTLDAAIREKYERFFRRMVETAQQEGLVLDPLAAHIEQYRNEPQESLAG